MFFVQILSESEKGFDFLRRISQLMFACETSQPPPFSFVSIKNIENPINMSFSCQKAFKLFIHNRFERQVDSRHNFLPSEKHRPKHLSWTDKRMKHGVSLFLYDPCLIKRFGEVLFYICPSVGLSVRLSSSFYLAFNFLIQAMFSAHNLWPSVPQMTST